MYTSHMYILGAHRHNYILCQSICELRDKTSLSHYIMKIYAEHGKFWQLISAWIYVHGLYTRVSSFIHCCARIRLHLLYWNWIGGQWYMSIPYTQVSTSCILAQDHLPLPNMGVFVANQVGGWRPYVPTQWYHNIGIYLSCSFIYGLDLKQER